MCLFLGALRIVFHEMLTPWKLEKEQIRQAIVVPETQNSPLDFMSINDTRINDCFPRHAELRNLQLAV